MRGDDRILIAHLPARKMKPLLRAPNGCMLGAAPAPYRATAVTTLLCFHKRSSATRYLGPTHNDLVVARKGSTMHRPALDTTAQGINPSHCSGTASASGGPTAPMRGMLAHSSFPRAACGAPHPHEPTATLRASLHSLATSASRIVSTITPPRSAPRAQWTYAGSAPHDAPHLGLRVRDEARWQHPALDEARSASLTTRNGCKDGDLPTHPASTPATPTPTYTTAHPAPAPSLGLTQLAPRTPNSCDASCPRGPRRPHRPIAAFQLYDPPPPLILSLVRHRSPACSPTQHRKTSRSRETEKRYGGQTHLDLCTLLMSAVVLTTILRTCWQGRVSQCACVYGGERKR
ncbi:hypothetical protein B0H13DRAFT_2507211 [Mycena leptocephala]|nr:hypothetical protein B0H13DRAFT_2507211 [Mycena leptocephala]